MIQAYVNFIKEYKDLHQKLNDVQNLAENCISSADEMKVNGKFLAEFASYYSSLLLRIQTLEKRDEVASMKEKAVNNLNNMKSVKSYNTLFDALKYEIFRDLGLDIGIVDDELRKNICDKKNIIVYGAGTIEIGRAHV